MIARRLREFINQPTDFTPDATPIETLVATILSQNTSDVNSHRAYLQLRASYESWDEVAAAEQSELAEVIRCGGLAEQKSRTIITALNAIRDRYRSFDLPDADMASDDELLNELTAIRGIGLKTAACVLMFSLNRDICAVDTHVHRIANRLGLVDTTNAEKTFHELRLLIPKSEAQQFHVDLIRFGRRICKSQRPLCFECPLYDLCEWDQKEEFAFARPQSGKPVRNDLLLPDGLRRSSR
jgi:endonuclease-3